MSAGRSLAAVCAVVLFGAVFVPPPALGATPPIGEVLLSDVPGFTLASETPGTLDSLNRVFTSEHAQLNLDGFPVTDPPGVRSMFQIFSSQNANFDVVAEPSFDLAVWMVPKGTKLGDGFASLVFAARDYVFSFALSTDGNEAGDLQAFVRDLAERQITAAGGTPTPAKTRDPTALAGDQEVVALLPTDVPAQYGLTTSVTLSGADELKSDEGVQIGVVNFLNDHASSATRVWGDDAGHLAGGVSITRYPYDIFAAASLEEARHPDNADVVSTNALQDVPNVVEYTGRGAAANQIGTAFRRGDLFVIVLVNHSADVPAEQAAALAADLTRLTAPRLPLGGTGAYRFPSPPSTLLGLAMSAAIVTAAAGGSAGVARFRARRAARRWATPGVLPPPDAMAQQLERHDAARTIDLDADAHHLRHRGAIVFAGQLLAVNVCIVALAGDFAWRGVGVAVFALLAGLLLTHWWQRRELALLGASAPPRQFVLPRPAGAGVGLLSLVVLGGGVGFAIKGLRYLVLPPSLAQLKWSNLLGVAPRTVGVIFSIGGFVVAVIGAWLYRLARALSRSGTKRVLEVDRRPAALYLRSFEDDTLNLPTIASARRPLFELFSVRGTDPFEESVAWELNSYGPVVAVGRPGRSLASLGAAREHLSNETWRDQVATRMEEAGIIAIATGETEGLAWELGEVVSRGHLHKTFFVFPPLPPDALSRRWTHTAASLMRAGQTIGSLSVPLGLVHTVRIDADGTATVTFADRRDEATYRTAVDRTVSHVPVAQPVS